MTIQITETDATGTGKLYLVPTPIGNLVDITLRGIVVLKAVDRILAEDTRHTRKLCQRHGIDTPMLSFNDHNARQRLPGLLTALVEGKRMALVSDAGMPGVSDPGVLLVRAVVAHEILLEVLPGATAVITALVGSGFPCDRFVFEGFLPRKGRDRQHRLAAIVAETRPVALFESPRRVAATLADLERVGCGSRPAVVARELSKLYETWYRSTVAELAIWFQEHPPRGEMVLVLGDFIAKSVSWSEAEVLLKENLAEGTGIKEAARRVAAQTGLGGSKLYKLALACRNRADAEGTPPGSAEG